jgi:hypothetical protein
MAFGKWGSRIPIGNLFFTSLVFLGLNWRLKSRRLSNRVRRRLQRKEIVVVNNSSAGQEMQRWIGQGYDRLNVGGGPKNLEGFVNVDFVRHKDVSREICANILDLSFIPSSSLAQVHSNHVVEHLSREQLISQFTSYFRILRPGGILTIRCPNALGAVYAFWFPPVHESGREEFLSLGFPPEEDFGNPNDAWLHKDFYGLLHWLYGDCGNVENEHLNQLTPSSLKDLLTSAGFSVERMSAPEAINLVVSAKKPGTASAGSAHTRELASALR